MLQWGSAGKDAVNYPREKRGENQRIFDEYAIFIP